LYIFSPQIATSYSFLLLLIFFRQFYRSVCNFRNQNKSTSQWVGIKSSSSCSVSFCRPTHFVVFFPFAFNWFSTNVTHSNFNNVNWMLFCLVNFYCQVEVQPVFCKLLILVFCSVDQELTGTQTFQKVLSLFIDVFLCLKCWA
jgi:hypothetical protein